MQGQDDSTRSSEYRSFLARGGRRHPPTASMPESSALSSGDGSPLDRPAPGASASCRYGPASTPLEGRCSDSYSAVIPHDEVDGSACDLAPPPTSRRSTGTRSRSRSRTANLVAADLPRRARTRSATPPWLPGGRSRRPSTGSTFAWTPRREAGASPSSSTTGFARPGSSEAPDRRSST